MASGLVMPVKGDIAARILRHLGDALSVDFLKPTFLVDNGLLVITNNPENLEFLQLELLENDPAFAEISQAIQKKFPEDKELQAFQTVAHLVLLYVEALGGKGYAKKGNRYSTAVAGVAAAFLYSDDDKAQAAIRSLSQIAPGDPGKSITSVNNGWISGSMTNYTAAKLHGVANVLPPVTGPTNDVDASAPPPTDETVKAPTDEMGKSDVPNSGDTKVTDNIKADSDSVPTPVDADQAATADEIGTQVPESLVSLTDDSPAPAPAPQVRLPEVPARVCRGFLYADDQVKAANAVFQIGQQHDPDWGQTVANLRECRPHDKPKMRCDADESLFGYCNSEVGRKILAEIRELPHYKAFRKNVSDEQLSDEEEQILEAQYLAFYAPLALVHGEKAKVDSIMEVLLFTDMTPNRLQRDIIRHLVGIRSEVGCRHRDRAFCALFDCASYFIPLQVERPQKLSAPRPAVDVAAIAAALQARIQAPKSGSAKAEKGKGPKPKERKAEVATPTPAPTAADEAPKTLETTTPPQAEVDGTIVQTPPPAQAGGTTVVGLELPVLDDEIGNEPDGRLPFDTDGISDNELAQLEPQVQAKDDADAAKAAAAKLVAEAEAEATRVLEEARAKASQIESAAQQRADETTASAQRDAATKLAEARRAAAPKPKPTAAPAAAAPQQTIEQSIEAGRQMDTNSRERDLGLGLGQPVDTGIRLDQMDENPGGGADAADDDGNTKSQVENEVDEDEYQPVREDEEEQEEEVDAQAGRRRSAKAAPKPTAQGSPRNWRGQPRKPIPGKVKAVALLAAFAFVLVLAWKYVVPGSSSTPENSESIASTETPAEAPKTEPVTAPAVTETVEAQKPIVEDEDLQADLKLLKDNLQELKKFRVLKLSEAVAREVGGDFSAPPESEYDRFRAFSFEYHRISNRTLGNVPPPAYANLWANLRLVIFLYDRIGDNPMREKIVESVGWFKSEPTTYNLTATLQLLNARQDWLAEKAEQPGPAHHAFAAIAKSWREIP